MRQLEIGVDDQHDRAAGRLNVLLFFGDLLGHQAAAPELAGGG
jgi:hypothetical protein